jgi:serine/threonine-protein kinase
MDLPPSEVTESPPPTVGSDVLAPGVTYTSPGGEPPTAKHHPVVAGHEILGVLGHGGMGAVYKARHLKLDRVVALKMILAGSHASPDQVSRFLTEAQAVAHLQHPNIVQIYEVGEADGLPYFALEFVDGGSLSDRLRAGPQDAPAAARLVETLARAMDHAHANGIVHRDLKPANILLTAAGDLKITDFGLAKRLEGDTGQTRTGAILGTPGYMAPEQAGGELRGITPATDVYALGAILYHLLTGRPPFQAATPMDTVMQLLEQEPVAPSRLTARLPRDLETICLKCLRKEPEQRYPRAGDLADDLARFLSGRSILARPVGRPERLWRWTRRNPGVAALAAAVLLLLLAVSVTSTAAALLIGREKEQAVQARHEAETNADLARRAQAQAEAAERQAKTAEQQAKTAQETAEGARRDADTNAALAHEQAGLALETLSNLLVSVRLYLKDTPGTQRLKQAFAKQALEKLARIAPNVERATLADASKAEAHRFLGTIYLELGKVKEARPHFEQCHAILAALAEREPSDKTRRDLTVADNALGDVHLLLGDRVAARRHYLRALAARQAIHDADPKSEAARVDLATSHVKAGNASDGAEALGHYQKALELRQALEAAAPPNATGPRRDVWIVYNLLGDLSLRGQDPREALRHYRLGLERAQKLVDLNPRSPGARHGLAVSHEKIGAAYQADNDRKAALEHLNKALGLLNPLVKEDVENLALQTTLTTVLARGGVHKEAAARAEALRRLAPEHANNLYNVGCCHALCAAATATAKGTEEELQALRRRYTDDALKALGQAIDQGFSNAALLQTDPDLDAVRADPGFAALLKKLR